MHPILGLDDVVKTYGDYMAVNHVSFDVPKGVIYGLLGPNGAGKTSIIRIITTITRADSGKVRLDGEPLNLHHPEQIGYMPEERGLYKKMKVGEQLLYLAQLKGLSRQQAKQDVNYWMERLDVGSWWNKKIEELSKGMQQKVQFIATVVHRPKLLILDEPFSGLDPINTNLIKAEIAQLNKDGVSIIFSTHRMEQVEEMCQYITLINKGRNILTGRVDDIQQDFKEKHFKVEFEGELPEDIASNHLFQIVRRQEHSLVFQVEEERASNEVLRLLIGKGVYVHSFQELLPTVNDIFIKQVEATQHA